MKLQNGLDKWYSIFIILTTEKKTQRETYNEHANSPHITNVSKIDSNNFKV